MNKAIFLDRDGTINVEVDYLHEIERLEFIKGVPQALAGLKAKGYKLIVISNQSGIGRGLFTSSEVDKLHQYMNQILQQYHAEIDAFYYCPHVESDHCKCRKPEIGLIKLASKDFNISLENSYMVGDKEQDVLTGIRAGCHYGLVLSGHEVPIEVQQTYKGYVYKDLLEFERHIGDI